MKPKNFPPLKTRIQLMLCRWELAAIRWAMTKAARSLTKAPKAEKPLSDLQRLKAFSESCSSALSGAIQLAHAASSPELSEGTKPIVQLSKGALAISLHLWFRARLNLKRRLILRLLRSRLLHRLIIPFTGMLLKRSCVLVWGSLVKRWNAAPAKS
jgi:hypothetical protein